MAMWPFRRKSRRKRVRASTTDFEESRGRTVEHTLPPRSQTLQDITMPDAAPIAEQSKKVQRQGPNKLQRKPRTYSFSPGRNDSINLGRRMSTRARREGPATTQDPSDFEHAASRRRTRDNGRATESPLNDDIFQRVPTLHNKRDGDHLPHKKSSKKRRKDDQREAEIKAMSSFMPHRSATDDWTVPRPLRKESRRVRTGFSIGFKGSSKQEWDKYNRSSDISLPAESLRSSLSSDSEHISFRVSALEALAPRPTLRYDTHSRPGVGGSDGGPKLTRGPSQQQRKLSAPIPEATLKAHKRIHDLADELSAGDLRDVMERDQRRRERKRQRDQEKLERELTRRTESQRAAEAEARKQGRDSPPNLERGVLGREVVGLGIDSTSAVVTSSRVRQPAESPKQKGKRPEGGNSETGGPEDQSQPDPLSAFHRTDSIPLQSPKLVVEAKPPPPPPPPPLTSPASKSSFIRLKLSRSKSPQESDSKTERSEPPLKGSETSSSRGPRAWTSFFRWAGRNKRASEGPSSFSNTSRDSMQTTQPPAAPVNFVPRRANSGVPKRTMSRFREDLPELPLSPPDSRIQSPEADPIPPTIAEASPDPNSDPDHIGFAPPPQIDRYDTPASEQRSMEAMRQTPSTFGRPDEPSVSPELQTMSLASIDSEGSWLSGRLARKRKSSGVLQTTSSPYGQFPQRTSDSDNEQPREHDAVNEDISITEDDYLAQFAPVNSERPSWNRRSAGDPRPSSDGEEEAHWGSVQGHQPTVIHTHTAGRIKSREGLLKAFGEEGEIDVHPASDDSGEGEDEGMGEGLKRATSINLSKEHVRRISAGSARLLSISPRSSVDAKRRSLTLLESTDHTATS
ncbi:hypothetical protein B0H67DRAFT_241305 [Lasiosphaeris hirsuta]|uniref:Uncharacterized protein n=1 Tax=Lasiosphaeris hirsuta TaxID=260670 RepID=A0AA40AGP2_9PEZI|nr:hypothetical protein B0H67DRAFT_241305 [Lasiosphaeris hirsuta]